MHTDENAVKWSSSSYSYLITINRLLFRIIKNKSTVDNIPPPLLNLSENLLLSTRTINLSTIHEQFGTFSSSKVNGNADTDANTAI